MNSIHVSTKLFSPQDWLFEALWDKNFRKLSDIEQVGKLWKLFREHVSTDQELSKQLMAMIRSATLFATGSKTLTDDELLKLSNYEFELMWRLSKKKVALKRFKLILGSYYDKLSEERKQELLEGWISRDKYIHKQIQDVLREFSWISNEILDSLWDDYGFVYDARLFLKTFNPNETDTDETITDKCINNGITPDVIVEAWNKFPFLNINVRRIEKEIMYESDESERLTGNYLLDQTSSNSHNSMIDNRNGFINPNWFLYDIDVEAAFKLWWSEKTKYIFGRYFRTGIEQMTISEELQLPDYYNFSQFRLKIDEDNSGTKKKLVDMAQHICEWEISKDFSQSDFSLLIKWLRWVLSDLKSSGEPKRFDHPIQTWTGVKNYYWFFSGSKWFENTHIIDVQPFDGNWKRVLRFASELGQDSLLFIQIQISYFLKNKKLLPSGLIWKQVYEMYNRLSLEGVEKFDPTSLKEQYDILVRKVIWPLSIEHKNKKGTIWKAHNMLLYWVYGTGKSQLLTHLISERKYSLPNGEVIQLEANVINIGIMEFADLLVKSISGFRKRLSDIHENTGRPIILVIEDIDTIVKEQWMDSDPVSQAMTTLFEWVGSLPVTVITSTNNPEILPQRHLRPNRLDTLVGFEYPIKTPILKSIFHTHWKKKWLDKILKKVVDFDYIESEILPKIAQFTPSHISAVCLSIYEALEFEDIEKIWETWVKKIIDTEIINCLVPIDDMKNRESSMIKWRKGLGTNSTKIWF